MAITASPVLASSPSDLVRELVNASWPDDQMPLLQRLRDRVGVKDGIPGLWLLIPGDGAAIVDGKAIPVISVTQRARIPESWLKNSHRGNVLVLEISEAQTEAT